MATALILDRDISAEIICERRERGIDGFDEVWEGVYVVSPLANLEHQYIASSFTRILIEVVQDPGLGRVFGGANVSDRERDWNHNFRVPDVVVALNEGVARDCDTHLCGGPDFLVEVLSEDDKSYEKLEFYAAIGVRELLIVEPESRRLELFRLTGGALVLAGRSSEDDPQAVVSAVVPLSFQWTTAGGQPTIQVTRTDGNSGRWTV